MCDNLLSGDAAEVCLFKAISASKKIKLAKLEGVLKKCKSSAVGRKYLEQAFPYLAEEFGVYTRIRGEEVLIINESDIPERVFVDWALGIDQVVNYMGHIVGIDITTNPEAIDKKLYKKQALSEVYLRDFDIDYVVILVVSERFSCEDVEKVIKQVILKGDYCQIRFM